MSTLTKIALLIGVCLSLALASRTTAAEPIKALLITGQQNHNWRYTSMVHKDTLEATGLFTVDLTDSPSSKLSDAKGLAGYQVVVIDYNGDRWGEPAETNFLNAVKNGAGVVIIHATNNSFVGWTEWEKMIALLWINGTTGHGKFHPFDVNYVDREPRITKGLSDMKAHPDELYHPLVNSQNAKFHLLASAMSSKESGGTGKVGPMALELEHGKGRVLHTPLGHVWTNSFDSKVSVVDPQFRVLLCRGTEWAGTGKVTLGAAWDDVRKHNTLTATEKAQGWKLLFDGTTTRGWRGYKSDKMPEGVWDTTHGSLWRKPGKEGGDIVTVDQYADFEFECEWNIATGGNSGIIYRCTEDHGASYETGAEMQVLDDVKYPDSSPKNRAGALYDLFALSQDVARPAGVWNHARVVCKGTRIEHWLNGYKVVDIDTTSEEYKKAFAASKWTQMPDMGTRMKGHIALQDHGSEVMYRNVKIRELTSGK